MYNDGTFFENLISAGFYPKISLPTRFDANNRTATLIDNIFTNMLDNNNSGVLTNSISDHQMIYSFLNDSIKDHNTKKIIEIETSNEITLNLFLEELKLFNLAGKINRNPFANPNKNYEIFLQNLSDVKQRILPKKQVKFNKRKHRKSPWITREIIKSINEKR